MMAQTMVSEASTPVADGGEDEALQHELVSAACAIARRRADLIRWDVSGRLIERGWLQWHGGGLRLTLDGMQVCDHALRRHR